MKTKRGHFPSSPLTQSVARSNSATSCYGDFLTLHFAASLTVKYSICVLALCNILCNRSTGKGK